MYKTQQIRLTDTINDETSNFLIFLCEQASKLSNQVVYSIRQKHFETCERVEFFDKDGFYRSRFKTKKISVDSYAALCKELKSSKHYQIMGGQQAQQTIRSVIQSFRSYNELLPLFFKGELKGFPRIPGYRTRWVNRRHVSRSSRKARYRNRDVPFSNFTGIIQGHLK